MDRKNQIRMNGGKKYARKGRIRRTLENDMVNGGAMGIRLRYKGELIEKKKRSDREDVSSNPESGNVPSLAGITSGTQR